MLDNDDLRQAVDVLRRGGVILYPTDTVWGLGCDARCGEAVRRIFAIKQRSDSKALITLVGSLAQLERTVTGIPEVAYQLIECSDRPTTIIYDGVNPAARLAPEVVAEDGTLGVRVTSEEFSQQLCLRSRIPLVSTSANISGCPSPSTFSQIAPEIINAVDYVCRSNRADNVAHTPSSIIRLTEGGLFKIIR